MITTLEINDNISLHYIPAEKLKTTAISMYIHRPLTVEDATKNAILPHILKSGCKLCKNATEIAHYLDNLYGCRFSAGISKRGEDHILCFDAETISDQYAANGEKLIKKAMDLLLSVVFDTLDEFDETTFELERTNSINKIRSIINDKRIYANYRCQEEMCKNDSFSVPRLGYEEEMKALTREALYAYYKEIITSSLIDIYICGVANAQEVAEQVKNAISGYSFTPAVMPTCDILKKDAPVNMVREKLNVTQGKLCMGFVTDTRLTDEDYFALMLGNAIYGGGAQSKLFNNVREKLSLAYYAGSMLNKHKGFLMVNAGIEFANYQKAYDEILAQLEEMKKGNITQLEFESSKGFIINSFNSYDDDQASMIAFYLGERICGTNFDVEYYKNEINKVKVEDVAKVMQKVRLDTVYFLEGQGE